MDNAYGIILGVILLFPWSVVLIMVAGTFWGKDRTFVRLQDRWQKGKLSLRTQVQRLLPSRVTVESREALPRQDRGHAISN
jgi:hypothetical protein